MDFLPEGGEEGGSFGVVEVAREREGETFIQAAIVEVKRGFKGVERSGEKWWAGKDN